MFLFNFSARVDVFILAIQDTEIQSIILKINLLEKQKDGMVATISNGKDM